MDQKDWRAVWEQEERVARIHGWDFSHIHGRYEAESDLPWNSGELVRYYLKSDLNILDYDTGGGEFLPEHAADHRQGRRYPGNHSPVFDDCEEIRAAGRYPWQMTAR